jgi:hypothetical protein
MRDALTPVIQTHLVTFYVHVGINGGCNFEVSTFTGKPSAKRGTMFDIKTHFLNYIKIKLKFVK